MPKLNENNLIWEAYTEASRRDFLKKTAGAIASTAINTPAAALKAVAPKFSYDLSRWVARPVDLRGSLDLFGGMLTTKGLLPHDTPDDKMNAALDDTFKKAHAGKLPANIWNTILQNDYTILNNVIDAVKRIAWRQFGEYAGPYKNDEKAREYWDANVIATIDEELVEDIDEGQLTFDDLKHLIPAGDIVVNGKTVMTAADVIKNKMLPSALEAARNLEKYTSEYTNWMKDFFVNPKGGESEYEQEIEYYKDAENKKYANSIEYSPSDYKGGVDPDTPKLALDSYNEDRYELRSTRDGYVIIDHSIRGPNNVLARFDRDEKDEAIARYEYHTKQMSPEEIRASFDKIRASFNEAGKQLVQCTKCQRAYSVDSLVKHRMSTTKCPHCQSLMKPVQGPHMHESSQLSSSDLEMAASIWPKKHFKSEEEWLAYVHKWWPKLPSIVNTLDKGKRIKNEASRGLAANKGEWEEVSDTEVSANKDVRQDIYDIIKVAYGPIGGHPDFPTVDKVPGDNNVNNVVDTDEPDDIDAAILSKRTSFGNKITTFASDGGAEAKRAAIAKTVDLLNTPGNYVEVSGKLMDILIAKGAPTVDDEDTVRAILKGKEIMWHGDGVYTREIGGKPYTKKMLGKPRV